MINRFKSFTQAQVQKLNTEFSSNSVFLADFNGYDSNEQLYTIELFKVFSTNKPLIFNGFAVNDLHKHNLRILFGDTNSRYYEPVQEHVSSGMRSDAIIKNLKKKFETEFVPQEFKKNHDSEEEFSEPKSKLIKSKVFDTEMQNVPNNSKATSNKDLFPSSIRSNNKPKFNHYLSTSGLFSFSEQISNKDLRVATKRKSFIEEQTDVKKQCLSTIDK
jgi:hypothetical protein